MLRVISTLCTGLLLTTVAVTTVAFPPGATASDSGSDHDSDSDSSCASTSRPLGDATGFTEFVRGNGTRGSESEGAIAYGGDLAANGMTVGTRLSSDKSDATLVVVGKHGQWFNLQRGSAYVDPKSGVNFNGGGKYLSKSPVDIEEAFAKLEESSAGWAKAPATGTATLGEAGGQKVLVLAGTDKVLNVFSVTPEQLVSGQGIAYDVPEGSGVLVNVSGEKVQLTGQMWLRRSGSYRQVDDSVMASWPGILWNFPAATEITMSFGSAWGGSILAPRAFLDVKSVGHTIGQVLVASFSSGFETHQLLYPAAACLPSGSDDSDKLPGIALDKTASAVVDLDGNGPDAGDQITYGFRVTNTGETPLVTYTVEDPMFGSVTCPEAALSKGAYRDCTSQTHTITDEEVAAGQVVNTATARGVDPHKRVVTDDDSTTTPVVPVPRTSNLAITKQVDNPSPATGDTVTYTLTVTATGNRPSEDVVVTDSLPAGVSFVSADAPCALSGTTVGCSLGTLPAGTTRSLRVRATVLAPPTGPAHLHQVDVQKTEAQIDLEAGQTRTVSITCAPGYVASDGSGRVDHVDVGTGSEDDVRLLAARQVGADGWEATMVNTAAGRAQGKVFAVCVKTSTETTEGHRHDLTVGAPVSRTVALGPTATDVTLSCAVGQTPVAPSHALDASAPLVTSYPSGGNAWTFTVAGGAATTGTFSIRCLDRAVTDRAGHRHDLRLTPVTRSLTIAPGATVEERISCDDTSKGVVAGWSVDSGLVVLGNDPRPVLRVFRLHNPTDAPLGARLALTCLDTRTLSNASGAVVTNTATVATATTETTLGDNTDRVSLTVSPVATAVTPLVTLGDSAVRTSVRCARGPGACTGTVRLVAVRSVVVRGTRIDKGDVLAQVRYRIASGTRSAVRLRPTATGRRALSSPWVRRAGLVVDGATTVVRIRR